MEKGTNMPIEKLRDTAADLLKKRNRLKELRTAAGLRQQDVAQKINIALKTYQQYERSENIPPADICVMLSSLYNVSIDYLLGIDDCTTVTKQNISDMTGLDDTAIDSLQMLKTDNDYIKKGIQLPDKNGIEILNLLLTNPALMNQLLQGISDYLKPAYSVPVYHDKKGNPVVPDSKYDVMTSGNHELRTLTLAKNKDTPNDNTFLFIDTAFLETVALKKITDTLNSYK